jgi:hypothetical protein
LKIKYTFKKGKMDMFINRLKGKIWSGTLATLLLAGTLYGCNESGVISATSAPASTAGSISVDFDRQDLDSSWDGAGASQITLKGDAITLNGQGAVVNGSTVTINSAGLYTISGTLHDVRSLSIRTMKHWFTWF